MKERYTKDDVIAELRKRAEGRTQADLAAEIPATPQYLSDVLSGRRDPGPRILEYLKLEVGYFQADK